MIGDICLAMCAIFNLPNTAATIIGAHVPIWYQFFIVTPCNHTKSVLIHAQVASFFMWDTENKCTSLQVLPNEVFRDGSVSTDACIILDSGKDIFIIIFISIYIQYLNCSLLSSSTLLFVFLWRRLLNFDDRSCFG